MQSVNAHQGIYLYIIILYIDSNDTSSGILTFDFYFLLHLTNELKAGLTPPFLTMNINKYKYLKNVKIKYKISIFLFSLY